MFTVIVTLPSRDYTQRLFLKVNIFALRNAKRSKLDEAKKSCFWLFVKKVFFQIKILIYQTAFLFVSFFKYRKPWPSVPLVTPLWVIK